MEWNYFIELFLWALAGFVLHVLVKMTNAKTRKPDFALGIFLEKNLLQYLTSLIAITIVCALVAFAEFSVPAFPGSENIAFMMVFVGYSGASFLKNLLKKKENV